MRLVAQIRIVDEDAAYRIERDLHASSKEEQAYALLQMAKAFRDILKYSCSDEGFEPMVRYLSEIILNGEDE